MCGESRLCFDCVPLVFRLYSAYIPLILPLRTRPSKYDRHAEELHGLRRLHPNQGRFLLRICAFLWAEFRV